MQCIFDPRLLNKSHRVSLFCFVFFVLSHIFCNLSIVSLSKKGAPQSASGSFQESADDLFFRLVFRKAERHQFDYLVSRYLSYRSFMNQRCVYIIRL